MMHTPTRTRIAKAAGEANGVGRERKDDRRSASRRWLVWMRRTGASENEKRDQHRPRFRTVESPAAHGTFAGGAGAAAGGFEKSTVGASRFAAFVTSKYGFGFAPMTFAVSAVGNVRMYVL